MAGTYALESLSPGGGTYSLSREDVNRLIGAPVDGEFRVVNVVTRKAVKVSNSRPLTEDDVRRISNE